jgi:hypothetical protein
MYVYLESFRLELNLRTFLNYPPIRRRFFYNTPAGTLYTSSGSGNSYKARLLAGILGIDLKHEEISLKVCCFFASTLAHQSMNTN